MKLRKNQKKIMDNIFSIINIYKNKTGIIYCFSQKECEKVAEALSKKGVSSDFYHAGRSDTDRTRVQRAWFNGKILVICATVAFGMGINKPNVRFVIHYSMPKSIEEYYQESGRAGRDGKESRCILFYSYQDKIKCHRLLKNSWEENRTNERTREQQYENLNRISSFCQNDVDCRRKILLTYFGELFNEKKL